MTVKELIAVLEKMPPDAPVAYRAMSDYSFLEESDVNLVTADESRKYHEDRSGKYPHLKTIDGAFVMRGGRCCVAYNLNQYPPDESPVYIDVVTLPGN